MEGSTRFIGKDMTMWDCGYGLDELRLHAFDDGMLDGISTTINCMKWS